MQRIKRTLQWLTGIVVGLYLAAMLLLDVPVVQRWAASGVASMLSSLLETNVQVGRIGLAWNGRILVDDLHVEDLQGEEMLRAARLGARLSLTDLARKRIRIGNAQLFGVHALLYQEKQDSAMNIQFLIDTFASKDTTKHTPIDLRISQVVVRRGQVRMEQRWRTHDLTLSNLNLTAQLNALTDDSLNLKVKRLDTRINGSPLANELELKALKLAFVAGQKGAELSDMRLALPHSVIEIPSMAAAWQSGRFKLSHLPRLSDISYQATIKAQVTPSDLFPLIPKANKLGNTAYLNLEIDGEGDDISIRQLRVQDGVGWFKLAASGRVANLQQGKESIVAEADIDNLHIVDDLIAPYVRHPILSRLASVDVNGRLNWAGKNGQGNLNIHSPLGNVSVTGKGGTEGNAEANITTEGFLLSELLDRKDLGSVSANVNVSADDLKKGNLAVDGTLSEFDFKGYRYRGIALDGNVHDKQFQGWVDIGDVNLTLHAEGMADLANNTIKGEAELKNFAPNSLNLTKKYPNTRFSGNADVDLKGTKFNDIEGTLYLNDFCMTDSSGSYRPGDIHLTSWSQDGEMNMKLISPFAEAQVKGAFQPKALVAQVRQMLKNYLPMIKSSDGENEASSDYGSFTIRLYSTEPLRRLLDLPLTISRAATAFGEFDGSTGTLHLNCYAPDVNYGKEMLRDVNVRLEGSQQRLQCSAILQRMMKNRWVEFGLDTDGKDGRLTSRLFWNNHDQPSYAGDISVISQLWKEISGQQAFRGEVLHSSLIVGDTLWNVHPGLVRYNDDVLHVDSFRISRGERFISIDGRASRSEGDTLHAHLQKINLEYVFSLINFHAVELSGPVTGHVYGSSLFSSPKADAYVKVPQFALNYSTLGDLDIHVGWGQRPYSILLDGKIMENGEMRENLSSTLVHGYITPKRDISYHGLDLRVNADRVNMAFLNKWTAKIFDDLEGRATGWVHIFGPFKQVNIEGDAVVNYGSLGVPFTGVRYHLLEDSVHLRPNHIYFSQAHIYDPQGNPGTEGHQGIVSGNLRHNSFKDLSFDINIQGQNILGYDFREFGDQNFYGTVMATGNVSLKGHPGEVRIGISARPERGTTFTYNATSPDKLTDTPFISYVNRGEWEDSKNHSPLTTESLNSLPPNQPPLTTESLNDLYIDFDLDIDEQSNMNLLMDTRSGDKISIWGRGNMRAKYYNKGAFELFGTYRISRGTYNLSLQEVLHKNFDFSDGGTITFKGAPFDADLDLQATHLVTGVSLNDINPNANFSNTSARVNCIMNIGGKARQPQLTFDFDILNANEDQKQMVRSLISTEEERNMQVIYLLGINRFYAYDYANKSQTQGTTAMNSLLSSTISGTINQALSNMLGKTNWNFGANLHTGEDKWNDMDVEGMLQGNLLNNRLLINGQFGYRDNPVANSNFIGDFDVKYLLTRSGSVALKAYSETNDRYFTKSSLTTQGIGILLKKDFTTRHDLKISRKNKRRRKERR